MAAPAANPVITVPVFVDDVKQMDGFNFARCAYFLIEGEDPATDLGLTVADRPLPLLVVGLSAVVHRPLDSETFDSPDLIDGLFDVIEQNDALRVDSANIWLPNFLLRYGGDQQERAAVYRIGLPVFTAAYQHWDGRLDDAAFVERCGEAAATCRHSPVETEVFAQWTARQVQQARENYAMQERRNQVLAWRATGSDTGKT